MRAELPDGRVYRILFQHVRDLGDPEPEPDPHGDPGGPHGDGLWHEHRLWERRNPIVSEELRRNMNASGVHTPRGFEKVHGARATVCRIQRIRGHGDPPVDLSDKHGEWIEVAWGVAFYNPQHDPLPYSHEVGRREALGRAISWSLELDRDREARAAVFQAYYKRKQTAPPPRYSVVEYAGCDSEFGFAVYDNHADDELMGPCWTLEEAEAAAWGLNHYPRRKQSAHRS